MRDENILTLNKTNMCAPLRCVFTTTCPQTKVTCTLLLLVSTLSVCFQNCTQNDLTCQSLSKRLGQQKPRLILLSNKPVGVTVPELKVMPDLE